MKQFFKIFPVFLSVIIAGIALSGCSSEDEQSAAQRPSTKRERNYMKEGKNLYDKMRYAEAEVSFKKALGENPDNGRARFNLASSYIKQRGDDMANKGDSLVNQADSILAGTSQSDNATLAELSFYDRGNLAFKAENYAAAIELYKHALRRNPGNNQARENLRLAQLKKQQQDQDKDKNQDKNQDNKDQQDQQDQQKQDQQQQQQQQQDQQDQQQDQQQQDQQQQQGGLSEQSAAQILKAMDDKEAATRMKVEQMKQGKEKNASRRQSARPW